jgi:hypothetical protein
MKSFKVCDAENGIMDGSGVNFCAIITLKTSSKLMNLSRPSINLTETNSIGEAQLHFNKPISKQNLKKFV